METNSQEKVFHLAITMAGAVSAGAYTAGVIDYLLEVLDRWKDLKKDPEFADKVPSHEIKIEILSGASAGGMTAAITSLALHRKKKHPICAFSSDETNSYDNDLDEEELKFRKKNNRLYNSWVNLTSSDMLAEMLKTDDEITLTTGEKSCVSALNSKFIKQLAQNTLSIKNREMPLELPEYVSKNLRTFVTLTNLDGFEKEVGFAGRFI